MPDVIFAEPTTTMDANTRKMLSILPPIQEEVRPPTVIPVAPAPINRPIDNHAIPHNTPRIQQQIQETTQPYRPYQPYDGLPSGGSIGSVNTLRAVQLTRGQQNAQDEAVAQLAYALGYAIVGAYDGLTGQYSDNSNLLFPRDAEEDAAYNLGRKAIEITKDGLKRTQELIDNPPHFDIPRPQIPKIELPHIPEFKLPELPEFKIPGFKLPELRDKDRPQVEKERKKYPIPEKVPGARRFKIPVLCNCAALLSFGVIVTGNNADGSLITSPGLSYMAYLVNNQQAPPGAAEYNPRDLGDYFEINGEKIFVRRMTGSIPNVDGINVYYFSITVNADQQGDGYVDLVMPTYKGGNINWGYVSTQCLGCEPRPEAQPDNPPTPPKKKMCCPEIDYRKIKALIDDAVENLSLAVPDSWLIRPEHDRPQLIIQFGEILGQKIGSPKYPLTIPHPKPNKPNKSAIPAYRKGNWEVIFVLKDNSKITVHAFNEIEAMKVLNAAKALVIPDYINGGYLSKSGKVITKTPLDEVTVTPKMAKYFPNGRKSQKPEWIVKF